MVEENKIYFPSIKDDGKHIIGLDKLITMPFSKGMTTNSSQNFKYSIDNPWVIKLSFSSKNTLQFDNLDRLIMEVLYKLYCETPENEECTISLQDLFKRVHNRRPSLGEEKKIHDSLIKMQETIIDLDLREPAAHNVFIDSNMNFYRRAPMLQIEIDLRKHYNNNSKVIEVITVLAKPLLSEIVCDGTYYNRLSTYNREIFSKFASDTMSLTILYFLLGQIKTMQNSKGKKRKQIIRFTSNPKKKEKCAFEKFNLRLDSKHRVLNKINKVLNVLVEYNIIKNYYYLSEDLDNVLDFSDKTKLKEIKKVKIELLPKDSEIKDSNKLPDFSKIVSKKIEEAAKRLIEVSTEKWKKEGNERDDITCVLYFFKSFTLFKKNINV